MKSQRPKHIEPQPPISEAKSGGSAPIGAANAIANEAAESLPPPAAPPVPVSEEKGKRAAPRRAEKKVDA